MLYEIEMRSELSGATLVVRFPEEDLDRKALYTLESDMPEFLLPFRHRMINGMVECTYQIGSRVKLQYRSSDRSPGEYLQFWNSVLTPLLECEDWFLKPFSFVLDSRYIYIDKDKTICYVYIPSKEDCVEQSSLQELAVNLSKSNRVTDSSLENEVLWSIMQGFQPKEFLSMIQKRLSKNVPAAQPETRVQKAANVSRPQVPEPAHEATPAVPEGNVPKSTPVAGDDIVINFGAGGKQKDKKEEKQKKKEKGGGLFGSKQPAEKKPAKKGGWLFGKKSEQHAVEIVAGAVAPVEEKRDTEKKPQVVYQQYPQDEGVTMLDEGAGGVTRFRLVGNSLLPNEILVNIAPGQSFTIGRYDVNVGHKQSDFEFDKSTKAVSRQHAAIERTVSGTYALIDLLSAAGTFVNGQKLTPNVPVQLKSGDKICFGTAGADYIWEE